MEVERGSTGPCYNDAMAKDGQGFVIVGPAVCGREEHRKGRSNVQGQPNNDDTMILPARMGMLHRSPASFWRSLAILVHILISPNERQKFSLFAQFFGSGWVVTLFKTLTTEKVLRGKRLIDTLVASLAFSIRSTLIADVPDLFLLKRFLCEIQMKVRFLQ
jgi:hypothetical protein